MASSVTVKTILERIQLLGALGIKVVMATAGVSFPPSPPMPDAHPLPKTGRFIITGVRGRGGATLTMMQPSVERCHLWERWDRTPDCKSSAPRAPAGSPEEDPSHSPVQLMKSLEPRTLVPALTLGSPRSASSS
ncbi:hypothetical protein AAFF_G00200980 [Aldrovandia affinis]|uniref:Uncharacterized protein n=1 Tax=Aldrovandia affinis TaxID=143900 RepID=A0AAD7RI94_9TELE|nr:hypothetical protein AAFF_G00200980 [Aldrovandia affinis]